MNAAEAVEILRQTPGTLRSLLSGLSEPWLRVGSRDDWGPYEVVAHLVEGERTDWVPRARTIVEHGTARTFEPFDREPPGGGAGMDDLLAELAALREASVAALAGLPLDDLSLRGRHPDLGEVTLGQLVATWAVHDLSHLAQVSEVLARRWREEIGPWRAYLPVVDREPLRD